MGQQQLLLMSLGVIIVGVTLLFAIDLFSSNAVDMNRQALLTDCLAYGAKAHRHYRKPRVLGGGGRDFNGFSLTAKEADTDDGTFNSTTTQPSGATLVAPEDDVIGNATTIYIEASGREIGKNGSTPVKVYVTITGDSIAATVLN